MQEAFGRVAPRGERRKAGGNKTGRRREPALLHTVQRIRPKSVCNKAESGKEVGDKIKKQTLQLQDTFEDISLLLNRLPDHLPEAVRHGQTQILGCYLVSLQHSVPDGKEIFVVSGT